MELGEDESNDQAFATVTVEVTPMQAEKLVFALEHTMPERVLTLALRSPGDETPANVSNVDWSEFDSIR